MKLKNLILFIGITLFLNNIQSQQTHDIAVGPFIHLPSQFVINTTYNIQTRIQNVGTSNETGVPIKWFVNGSLINTTYKNLNAGQIDSVSNNWMPAVAGTYTLIYVSALATDTNRSNDTVKVTVNVLASLPGLCEGFNSTTFPPAQWNCTNSTLIFRSTYSAYGNGTGSAYFDFWNQVSGVTGDLVTKQFNPTATQDSIHFALAYCLWSGSANDEVAIYSSTNAGSNFTLLHTMTAEEMITTSSCTHPLMPTAGQWDRRAFVLPVGTDMIKFEGISAFGDGVYIDSVGTNACWNYTGIANNGDLLPKVYSLLQNYPNPFNPTTKIEFALPIAGNVKLVIYDILGAKITTIFSGHMEAGNHTVSFNGENLASGVYFYKIESNEFTAVKKMVLIK